MCGLAELFFSAEFIVHISITGGGGGGGGEGGGGGCSFNHLRELAPQPIKMYVILASNSVVYTLSAVNSIRHNMVSSESFVIS